MRRRLNQEQEDSFSDLPGGVVGHILSRLTIKEVIRTTCLSTEWIKKWHSVPRLVFDDRDFLGERPMPQLRRNFERAVISTLNSHPGPKEFKLSQREFLPTCYIDTCLDYLSNGFLQELAICMYSGLPLMIRYKMSPSLFKCEHLTDLKLIGCSFIIPDLFEGFKRLISLSLDRISLCTSIDLVDSEATGRLDNLITSCPKLKHLVLKDILGIVTVKVDAPHLESFCLGGDYLDVSFGDEMNHLNSVSEGLSNSSGNIVFGKTNLHNFLRQIPYIKILKFESYSLQFFAPGCDLLPDALAHLECLSVCVDFNSKKEVLAVISMMRIPSALKKLEIQVRPQFDNRIEDTRDEMTDFWKEDQFCCLEQVQIVSMDNISATDPELEFLKFLLKSLPNLKTMRIRPGVNIEGNMLRDLLQFAPALTQADVIISSAVDVEDHA